MYCKYCYRDTPLRKWLWHEPALGLNDHDRMVCPLCEYGTAVEAKAVRRAFGKSYPKAARAKILAADRRRDGREQTDGPTTRHCEPATDAGGGAHEVCVYELRRPR